MKILHLADLHIGKKVNDFCMLNEQKFVLNQALDLIKKEKIEAVLIAGDVFDKAIPSVSALELFDLFLKELNFLSVKVFIISGNHDNMDRLAYLSNLLKTSDIYISQSYDGKIQSISLNDDIEIYLMPYLYPALVRKYYENSKIANYNDAISLVVNDIKLDENKVNIIVAHQLVIGSNQPLISQSEQKSVGGIDEVSYKIFEKFDYCALGHLHCAQKCSSDKIRYSGSILKYSFSEINQNKKFTVLNIKGKNEIELEFFPINFLHEMREYRGKIDDFLDEKFYKTIKTDDYIHFILEDEYVLDAKKKLSLIYPNIMLLEFDNTFTRSLDENISFDVDSNKTMFEHFCDFYKLKMGDDLSSDKENIVKKLMGEINNETP